MLVILIFQTMLFMLLTFFVCALAIPLSYFQSKKSKEWSPPPLAYFEGGYRYESPQVAFPIVPIWSFGFRFDLDIMVALEKDEPWGMIEVSYIQTKEGEKVWFTLDSRLDGQQYIGLPNHSASKQISSLFPLPSYDPQLVVQEKKNEYVVSYMRGDEPISFSMPRVEGYHPPASRNGHAMNHAQHDLMAILDISSLKLKDVDWTSSHKTQSILWQPISGVMRQTVSGLRRGEWHQTSSELHHQLSSVHNTQSDICLETKLATYCFAKHNTQLQLHQISLFQPLQGDQIASVVFSPALPDLRFGLKDTHCSQVYWNLNDREHLQGELCVHPLQYNSSIAVSFEAQEPSWVSARPVLSILTMEEDGSVFGKSILLSNEAQDEHEFSCFQPKSTTISIPESLEWDGSKLSAFGSQGTEEGIAYSAIVPLVPKDDYVIGRIEVTAKVDDPFLLGINIHQIAEIRDIEFQVHAHEHGNTIELKIIPNKPSVHGGWAEIDIGALPSQKPTQSVILRGRGEGGGVLDREEVFFLDSFQVESSRALLEFSLPISPTIEPFSKEMTVEKSLFWTD